MSRFNLDDYEPVEARLVKFWNDCPTGRVITDLIAYSDTQFIVQAAVYRDGDDARPWATGYAEETVSTRGVNQTSALENCETSAIGRALANAGYATKGKRPSREEMQKVQRREQAAAPALDAEELTRLRDVIAAVDSMDEALLKQTWTAHQTVLDVLPEGAPCTLRAAVLARKEQIDGGVA